MNKEKIRKYQPFKPVRLPDRTWPESTITKAPVWCSVDLRDGNQALIQPMNLEEKLEMFQLLVNIGFKEIEVGFPSSSQVEYDFCRILIKKNLIPDDVSIQVLTQAREKLIKKTFEAIDGAPRAVVHLYNSTSTLQRKVVFRMEKKEIIDLAVLGATLIREEAVKREGDFRFEYSPESFTGTELDFALEICEAVIEVWEATPKNPVILNLPATVEMATPNVYADQIEWFIRNLDNREAAIISVHTHNDRGTGVAATELALLAGADRVEGTLFGNGERTGNVDILTLALNMYTQGIDPELDFSDIDHVCHVYQRCTRMQVHSRHPYAGELVYTAFSGSHQDAINKGMQAMAESADGLWQVPYLPIDPEDVGRSYESIIRINSQSGKGGVAYVMEQEFGFKLPRSMHAGFGRVIQGVADVSGTELSVAKIYKVFEREYLSNEGYYRLVSFNVINRLIDQEGGHSLTRVEAVVAIDGREMNLCSEGNGPLDAFCRAMRVATGLEFALHDYHEHALARGASSQAVTYIEVTGEQWKEGWWGAGIDSDIVVSSIKALISALNRAISQN